MSNPPLEQAAAAAAPLPRVSWRPEITATLKLGGPLILTQLAQAAIGTTDTVMMGWLGPRELASGSLGVSFYFPLYLFCLGVLISVSPLIAQALGARQRRGVRHIMRQGLWVGLILGLLFSLLIWHARPILLAFGQEAENARLAESYLRAAVWGLIPSLWLIALRAFAMAHSRPNAVLAVMLIGVAVNALGDYALMFGHFGFPALGLMGAGIATTIVNTCMFAVLLTYVLRDRSYRRYALLLRLWRPNWPRFFELWRVGLPIGFSILAETGLFATAAFLMGILGTNQLAAHAIALQCASLAFMVPLGLSQAATVRVGLAAGARDSARVGRAGWIALVLGAGFAGCSALVFWLLPEAMVGVFLDLTAEASQPVLALGITLLHIAALFQLFDATQIVAIGALRGLKDTRAPLFIALVGYWPIGFGLALLLAFGLDLGARGIWIGLASGLAVLAFAMVWRFHRRERFIAGLRPAPFSL